MNKTRISKDYNAIAYPATSSLNFRNLENGVHTINPDAVMGMIKQITGVIIEFEEASGCAVNIMEIDRSYGVIETVKLRMERS